MTPIRIAIHGAAGRMGQAVCAAVEDAPDMELVGRADPRGEQEYNMELGENRAHSVKSYLSNLGVEGQRMALSSRGALDETGTDEEGWRKDRRVDIELML